MSGQLDRLYDQHANAMFAFLLGFTRSEADTKDVMQEVFVRLARRPALLNGVRDEQAYLLRLARNAAIDAIRRVVDEVPAAIVGAVQILAPRRAPTAARATR